ncbi:MAG: tetratricopeptide repeat protein [Chitinophagaceae bacterium]
MKRILLILLFTRVSAATFSQPVDIQQQLETARSFERQADYDNAILVLTRALQSLPDNTEVIKELAFAYYMSGQNDKALNEIKKIADRDDADEQVFQIAGNIYKGKQDLKEADRIYKKGIKKFPSSGSLYSEYGELLYTKEPGSPSSIKTWEKGIEVDPNFSGNYYYAAKYYGTIGNDVWSLLYGEIFVNLESYSTRTIEVKNVLFDIYKQWFVANNIKGGTDFEVAFANSLNKQSREAAFGLTPEVLTAIRTRFILEWFSAGASRPAFRLFDYQRQLLQEGLFGAYNQWLFGSVVNTSVYQNWVTTHAEENAEFIKFQRGRIFKMPMGQYYGAK